MDKLEQINVTFKERKELIGLVTKNKEALNECKILNFFIVFLNDGKANCPQACW